MSENRYVIPLDMDGSVGNTRSSQPIHIRIASFTLPTVHPNQRMSELSKRKIEQEPDSHALN